jgi:hypothetical protein
LRFITRDWKMPPREWRAATTQFAIRFEDRYPAQRAETGLREEARAKKF